MVVILLIFLFLTSLYLGWVLWLYTLWRRLPESNASTSDASHLSILVPFRNESENLKALCQSLQAVLSHCQHVEVLFIDDHSSDDSIKVIQQFQSEYPGTRLLHQTDTFGKKKGVDLGVATSIRPWIVALDADVVLPANWLVAVAAHTAHSKADMLILPLRIGPASNLISRLQEVEFLSVMGVTASMAAAGLPILCNGANLCFRKEAYESVRRQRQDFHITSGDDLFLLHALKAKHTIAWVHDLRTQVATQPHVTLRGFAMQRLRWMGKTSRMDDSALRYTAWLTFGMNALVIIGFCMTLSRPLLLPFFLLFFIAKAIADALLIFAVGEWMCIKRVKRFYGLLIFIYPLYATLFPLISILYKPTWKGRATNIA